ncbi:MAG: Hsp70 family protein [Ruminococcus flavefaciens]|nr:Hsp70 family protein [Ruminococcus flavefaciens]MCM1228577.1 Hsp70 family protein [Ruminococcus flavefaciens]
MGIKNFRIGMDFGTTFSFVGYIQNGVQMNIVPTIYSHGVPSVFFDNGKQKLFGKFAERKLTNSKDRKFVVSSIKRRISDSGVILDTGSKKYTAEDVIYEIINDIVISSIDTAKENYQLDFDSDCNFEAVITVPVDFTEPQKNLIRTAASRVIIPGTSKHLVVLRLLPEPVAASMEYFGVHKDTDSNILVLDLGGGTFDVAWVKSNSNNGDTPYEVIDQDGDKELGGNDWDKLIADHIIAQYEKEYDEKVSELDINYIMSESRNVKEALTNSESEDYYIELHGNSVEGTITRSQFNKMAEKLMNRFMAKIEAVMNRQGGKKLDHVIMTGGSSYMPMIQEAVRRRFSKEDVRIVDPAHAIAYGAARYAMDFNTDVDSSSPGPIQLIASHAYGISYHYSDIDDSQIYILIPKGAKLPFSASTTSYTRWDNWDTTNYRIYETDSSEPQGTRIGLSEGKEIMNVRMDYNPPVPNNSETTETLTLSQDELLSMTAVSEKYNKKVQGKVSIARKV